MSKTGVYPAVIRGSRGGFIYVYAVYVTLLAVAQAT
jgi:hypothetical protein